MPSPLRAGLVMIRSLRYLAAGLRCIRKRKIEVPLLDAAAIGVSVLRRDFNTAGSVMFLLGVGELLEEWTHKKSVGDLARSMSLNIKKGLAEAGRAGNSGKGGPDSERATW